MEVKTDTKERFHVIKVETLKLTANMAANLYEKLTPYLQTDIRSVVLILKDMKEIDEDAAELLVKLQQRFYDENASFVICELSKEVEDSLEKLQLLELMNVTPTESEAWDIVQMEEIEREFLDEPDSDGIAG